MVLLPCAVNTALVMVLEGSLDRAYSLMQLSRRQSIIINTLSCDTLVVTGILSVGNNAIMNGAVNRLSPLAQSYFTKLEDGVNSIAANSAEPSTFETTRREILSLLDKQQAILSSINDPRLAADSLLIKLRRTKPWLRLCGRQSFLLNQALSNAQMQFQQSVQMQRKEQDFTLAIVATTVVFNAALAVMLAILFQRDIAERITTVINCARKIARHEPLTARLEGHDEINYLYHDLRRASEDLLENEQFRGSVMQMMAHDIRSPLMASAISLEVMEHSLGDAIKPQSAQRLRIVEGKLQYCLALINDLLLLESLENGATKPHKAIEDLQTIVEAALDKVRQTAAAKQLNFSVNVEPANVFVDFDHLCSAFDRLISRALNRAAPGSTIVVNSGVNKDLNKVLNKTNSADCTVTISYFDSSEDAQLEAEKDSIFDKYQHLANPGLLEGKALSMPVVAKLIEAQGGQIAYRGDDQRMVFTLSLPLSPSRNASSDEGES